MADFDNGLPPTGTTTEGQISNVSVKSEEFNADDTSHVEAIAVGKQAPETIKPVHIENVAMSKELYDETEPIQVKNVAVGKEIAGMNFFTMV